MQIVCPACATRYDVPDARLAPGKRVKCARCGDGWTPIAPVVELLEPNPPQSPPPPPPAVSQPQVFASQPVTELPPTPRSDRVVLLGWLATAIVLAAALILAKIYRGPIEHAWPPSARVYDLF